MKKVKRKALSLMLVVSLLLGMTPDVPAMAAKAARGLADCIEDVVVTESSYLPNDDVYELSSGSETSLKVAFKVRPKTATDNNATWASASNAEKASISNASSSNASVIVEEITEENFSNKNPWEGSSEDIDFWVEVNLAENAVPGNTSIINVKVGNATVSFNVRVIDGEEPVEPTITITSANGNTGSDSVELGNTLPLTAVVTPENSDYVGAWSSANSNIATVDLNGLVTPLQVGATDITYSVSGAGTASGSITINVIPATPGVTEVPVTNIEMDLKGQSNSMGIGESRQIYAYARPYNVTNKTLEFTSSDDSIATVALSTESSNSAIVTGLKAGKVIITAAATDRSKVTSSMEFEVLDVEEVTEVTVNNGKNAKMRIGAERKFSVTTKPANAVGLKQTWKSSNTDIVMCNNGYVIAEGVGTATVSVTIKGITSSFEVEVWAQELGLALSRTKVTLQEGTETKINAIITEPDLGNVGSTEWKSSNPEVLEITEGVDLWANVSAKSAGTAVLTATLDGKEATCEFTVTKDVVVPTPADKIDAVLEENRDKLYSGSAAEKETAVKKIFDAVQDAMKDVKIDSMNDDDMTAVANLEKIILDAMQGKFNSTDWDYDNDVALTINDIKGAVLNLPTDLASVGPVNAKMTIANMPTTSLEIPDGVTGAQAFDINLSIVSNTGVIGTLTDLKVPVEINMEIPDELLNAENPWVYNYHGSNIIKIKPTIHGDGTMTIRVNKFSPFVLMDIPTSGGGGSSSSSGSSNSSVRDNGLRGQWVQDSTGWWFKNTTGGYPKNQWAQINTKWYHFDNVGYMQTGWILLNNSWYYLKPQGDMASKEWVDHNGKRYYLHDNGTMMSNQWFSYNNNWYYMGTDGAMLTNATTPDGHKVDAAGIWVK